jgi:tetratricopeptide (TPR) repeat protein
MLIAQLEPPHLSRGGDWYYRTFSPGLAMAEHQDVWVVDLTNVHRHRDAILKHADVVVLNMVCDPDLLPVVAERTRQGLPTVYEVNDDVACLQPYNTAAGFYANPDNQILFRMLVQACSAVQFCTPELQRIYGRFSSKAALFPNQMLRLPAEVVPAAKSVNSRTVVGWGGSFGHLQDLAEIAQPLIDWVSRRQDVVLHLMCADKIWALFDRLAPDKKRLTKPAGIEEYHDFVAHLDIGLAPVEDTGFNRCRSDVKFLEYALHGVAPVLRALVPYQRTVEHGATGMLFHDSVEMLSMLDELVENVEYRQRIAANAKHYIVEQRQERAHAVERIEFYRSLLSGSRANERSGLLTVQDDVTRLEGAEVQGRFVTLNATRYERLLHDALVLGQLNGRKGDALGLLREASQLEPNAYQPHLFSADLSDDPTDCLALALTRNPKSLNAHVLMGEFLAKHGQVRPALTTFLAAAEIHPSYDLPYLRLAQLMLRCNLPTEAKGFFEAAISLRQPYLDPIS